MAKKMGEFEERPQVKEAMPVPLKRERPTAWIIATIVFALIAFGAVGYIIIDKTAPKKTESTQNGSGQEGLKNVGMRNKEDYDEIIDESLAILKDKLSKDETIVADSDKFGGAYIKIDDGVYTTLDYGRSVGVETAYVGLEDERGGDLADRIESVFTKHGFEKDDSLKNADYVVSYTDGKGSICQYRSGGPLVVCGHETWISDENRDLVEQLWAAYMKNKEPTEGAQTLLIAKTSSVKASAVAGYKHLEASVHSLDFGAGAAALFYKKDDGEWQFFGSAQAALACDLYTGDAAKAFAGDPCTDRATGASKKVGE